MIEGRVVPGVGSVSRRVTGERLKNRRKVCGMPIVPGTLNIDARPEELFRYLPEPSFTCEDAHRLGPLRWWPVIMEIQGHADPFLAYYVRHVHSEMKHLEVCSDVHFRSLGIQDGDRVVVVPL